MMGIGSDVETQQCSPAVKRWTVCGAVAAIGLLMIILLATSLKKLKSTEYGLQYAKYSKQLDDAARVGGLHIGPPGFKFIKFPSTQVTVDLPDDNICVSKDGLRIGVSVTFQYQMPAEWLRPAVMKYRNFSTWAQVVEAAGNSAVHHACSDFNVLEFQTMRGVIQTRMEESLKIKLEGTNGADDDDNHNGVYARSISLQLQDLDLPEQYTEAVAEKQTAAEDIALAKNQRVQEVTKATTALKTAEQEAKIINNTALTTVEITLTQARSKAAETTFAYQTESNLIVSVQRSLNLTVDGVLGWLSNQLLAAASNLKVTTAEPASLSRKSALESNS